MSLIDCETREELENMVDSGEFCDWEIIELWEELEKLKAMEAYDSNHNYKGERK